MVKCPAYYYTSQDHRRLPETEDDRLMEIYQRARIDGAKKKEKQEQEKSCIGFAK